MSVSLALAARIVGDTAEGEDVLQEVFLRVWEDARQYDSSKGSVSAWILTSVRNAAIDRLRRRDAYRRVTRQVEPREVEAPRAGLSEDQARVVSALQQLPAEQREAIELAYFEGLTQTQIAERLNQPLGTVKARIRLGMNKLRDAMTASAEGRL
jgi:RNA polymerase sigma-70 factor (ECF subfamily)